MNMDLGFSVNGIDLLHEKGIDKGYGCSEMTCLDLNLIASISLSLTTDDFIFYLFMFIFLCMSFTFMLLGTTIKFEYRIISLDQNRQNCYRNWVALQSYLSLI